jgi:outer membrane immunogenic protein
MGSRVASKTGFAMKKLFLLSVAMVALSVAPAFADGAPPPAADPMASPFGWYAGAFIGGGWGHATTTDVDFYNGPPPFSMKSSQTEFGVHGGYNYNVYDSVLIGAEAEAGDLQFKVSQQYPAYIGIRLPTDSVAQARANEYVALSAKVGYVWDILTVYGKVGGFWSDDRQGFIDEDPAGLTLVSGTHKSQSSIGLVWGGGLDLAISEHWSAGLEFEYFNFPHLHNTATASDSSPYTFSHTLNDQTIKLTASYHCDWL